MQLADLEETVVKRFSAVEAVHRVLTVSRLEVNTLKGTDGYQK